MKDRTDRCSRVLAIDIGNSTINMGFFADGGLAFVHKMDTAPLRTPKEYFNILKGALPKEATSGESVSVVISSVVPGHTKAIGKAARLLTGERPLIVGYEEAEKVLKFGLKAPEKIGADRIAASVASLRLYGPPVAAVDFGTATTVNFIGKRALFKGGAILPGVGLMCRCLSGGTAKLPEIAITKAVDATRKKGSYTPAPLGKDTESSILSGAIFGTAGAVERVIKDVEKAEGERYKVVLTGGYAGLIAPHMKRGCFIEPSLVLKGLKIMHDINIKCTN